MQTNITAFMLHFWYVIAAVFVAGIFITLLFQKKIIPRFNQLKQKAQLIKKYWTFVLIFVLLSSVGYIAILIFTPSSIQSLEISIYNNVLALVFAIFVGYFAFLQVIVARRDKVREEADRYLLEKNYPRAIDLYEKCLSIEADDFDVLANLLELYLIEGRDSAYNEKISIAKSKIKYPEHELTFRYLLCANDLIRDEIGSAKRSIDEVLNFVKENTGSLSQFRWRFEEVKNSDKFSRLTPSTKKIYMNLADYLLRKMTPEKRIRFENGDYETAD